MSQDSIRYLLGIDAGGTKTIARLIDLTSTEQYQQITGTGSLTNDTALACNNISEIAESLIKESQADASATLVVCGAAGAENEQNISQLRHAFGNDKYARVVIKTDAYISLIGATSGKPGVAVAIGTGSIALRLDDEGTIKQFGGWGFRVGDQGSGAHLGRSLVIEIVKAFDREETSSGFVQKVMDSIGHDRQTLLQWIKTATARDFAGLCPIIANFRDTDTLAKKLFHQAIKEVDDLIVLARGTTGLPVFITGGLGRKLFPYLTNTNQDWLMLSEGDAIDGAILIGRQASL